jgi:hypothetical protein
MKCVTEYFTTFHVRRGHMIYVVDLTLDNYYSISELFSLFAQKFGLNYVGEVIDFLSRSCVEQVLCFRVRVGKGIDHNSVVYSWSDSLR